MVLLLSRASSPIGWRRVSTYRCVLIPEATSLLKAKAHQSVHTITPAASVFDALKLMAAQNIGSLLVMEGEEVVGIITERDYAGRSF